MPESARTGELAEQVTCVILAGGRGKRMGTSELHKVCFPVAGIPAIQRALRTYRRAGISRFLVVVGQMAEQVMSYAASADSSVIFAYQRQPRGTGDAVRVAVDVLAAHGLTGPVMVVMGDKVTWPDVVRRFLERFAETNPDLLLSLLPAGPETTAGRIVRDPAGRVLGVVESADIRRSIETNTPVRVGGMEIGGEEIEALARHVNASMYLFRFPALVSALGRLSADNAQGELYLTDTVEILAREGRVEPFEIERPEDLMAFNTPKELLAVEAAVQRREHRRVRAGRKSALGPAEQKPLREWLSLLEAPGAAVRRALAAVYGGDAELAETRRRFILRTLEHAVERLGPDRPVVVCRAPGRINLMGRHVDHRGGRVNVMAISREVVLVAAGRDDDVVRIENLDAERFPAREFRIADLLQETSWEDWLDFLDSATVRQVIESAPGDWSHYVRAPLLRLQHECPEIRLRGMDCVVGGDIPMGAGLSSSSALVVAFAEAAVALNRLELTVRDFVDLCGEGEWFVGSRGGSADHAAIRTGEAGCVSQIDFFPFHISGTVRFPESWRLVVADSGEKAVKSAGARDVFNQRVAAYEISERLLQKRWPPAAAMEHLRDLAPERLQVPSAAVYFALKNLPETATRSEIRSWFAGEPEIIERLFASHRDIGPYDLRGVALFGISECVRSRRFGQFLDAADAGAVRRAMLASHNGDRVRTPGRPDAPFRVPLDDAVLDALAAVDADLADQSGRYACSTPAIDTLVDLALGAPGVIGAQLAGAGLGGSMMVLVERDAAAPLIEVFRRGYYEPRGMESAAYLFAPVSGAGLLRL